MQSVAVAISLCLEIANEIDHRQTRRQKLTVCRELYIVALVAPDYFCSFLMSLSCWQLMLFSYTFVCAMGFPL